MKQCLILCVWIDSIIIDFGNFPSTTKITMSIFQNSPMTVIIEL